MQNTAQSFQFDSPELTHALVNALLDLVIVTDPEGSIIFANLATEQITGFSKRELMGTKAGKLWGGLMEQGFYQSMWDTIKNQRRPFSAQVTNKRKNGEEYTAYLYISPVVKNGELTNFISIERDISQETDISKMKSEFLSLASHQLRTPLTTIKWSSEMLASGEMGKLNSDQQILANNIHEADEILIEIVNTFLDVTKLEAGKMKPEPTPTNLKKLVSETVYLVSEQINNKKQKLNLQIDDSIDLVNIDPKLIRQVYLNLLSNATKYSPENTEIAVEIKIENGFLISQVTDHGQGIPEQDRDKIFSRFFRAGNAVQKVPDGNGLGLYFVKIIIEACNGEVGFKSETDKGSMFWFKVPLVTAQKKQTVSSII